MLYGIVEPPTTTYHVTLVGARLMIQDHCMDGVDEVYGMHNLPIKSESTEIQVAEKEMMAHMIKIMLKVIGEGGHGSSPEKCVDPVPVAVQFYADLYENMKQYQDAHPTVRWSFPCFQAANACNVIPDQVEIQGTLRVFSKEDELEMLKVLDAAIQRSEASSKCKIEKALSVGGEGAVINTPQCAEAVRKVAKKLYGEDKVGHNQCPIYASEDFADFLQLAPGAFFFRITKNLPETVSLHTPSYDFDDSVIGDMSEMWLNLAIDRLSSV